VEGPRASAGQRRGDGWRPRFIPSAKRYFAEAGRRGVMLDELRSLILLRTQPAAAASGQKIKGRASRSWGNSERISWSFCRGARMKLVSGETLSAICHPGLAGACRPGRNGRDAGRKTTHSGGNACSGRLHRTPLALAYPGPPEECAAKRIGFSFGSLIPGAVGLAGNGTRSTARRLC